RGRTCRSRAGASPYPGPSDRSSAGPRRGETQPRRSRRTWPPETASSAGWPRPERTHVRARAARAPVHTACRSLEHLHAHAPRRPRHDVHGGLDVPGVEVCHLLLGDLAELLARDPPDLVPVGLARTLLEPCRLLDELGRRRLLGDKGERAVLVDGELDGDHLTGHVLGPLVVL